MKSLRVEEKVELVEETGSADLIRFVLKALQPERQCLDGRTSRTAQTQDSYHVHTIFKCFSYHFHII